MEYCSKHFLKELSVNETDNPFLMNIHVKIVRIKNVKKFELFMF